MTTDVMENGENVQDQSDSQVNVQQQDNVQTESHRDDGVPKARVQEIVQERTKHAAQKAYERGVQETEQRRQESGMGGMQSDEGKLREMMANVFKEQHAELQKNFEAQEVRRQLDQLAQDYMSKLNSAKDKYPDLEKRRDELGEMSYLIPYINETDEVAGITNHLLNNEHNVASLLVLAEKAPGKLRSALRKLGQSIKTNDEARNRDYPNEPASQVTPSIYTTDSDSGSIEALKQQPWLRG